MEISERLFRPTSGIQRLERQSLFLQQNLERFQGTLNAVAELKDKVLSSEMTALDQDRVFWAMSVLIEFHKDQNYTPEIPYTEHPLGIALQVFDAMKKKDAKTLIVALLHDTPEDQAEKVAAMGQESVLQYSRPQDAALAVLERMFGPEVEDALYRLTNDDFEETLDLGEDVQTGKIVKWGPEYTEKYNALYRDHVVEMALASPRSALVKYFDFAANAYRIVTKLSQEDMPKAQRIGKKYLPLFADYIKLFQNADDELNIREDVRKKALQELKAHQSELEDFLN